MITERDRLRLIGQLDRHSTGLKDALAKNMKCLNEIEDFIHLGLDETAKKTEVSQCNFMDVVYELAAIKIKEMKLELHSEGRL